MVDLLEELLSAGSPKVNLGGSAIFTILEPQLISMGFTDNLKVASCNAKQTRR